MSGFSPTQTDKIDGSVVATVNHEYSVLRPLSSYYLGSGRSTSLR